MFTFTSVQIYLFTNEKVVIFVKTSVMREKLLSLMRSEGLTSSRLAELLGIQPSGISHILSGRNKPSFDFVQKILRRFPTINPDWLLLDQGPMYRDTADSAACIATLRILPRQQIHRRRNPCRNSLPTLRRTTIRRHTRPTAPHK